jgi:hypothetical protein
MRTYRNFSEATLSSGIAAGATSCTVTDISDLDLPASPSSFWAVIYNYTDNNDADGIGIPGQDAAAEIVDCYSVASATISIKRGQQGTTDAAHNTGGKTYRLRLVWTRTDAERSESRFNVLDYNADPTGATSSDAAINAAVAAADGVAPVYFPAGIYDIDTVALGAGAKVDIVGDGRDVVTLRHKSASSAAMFSSAASTVVSRLTFRGVTIDGNAAGQTTRQRSIIYVDATRLAMHDCATTSSVKAAIRTHSIRDRLVVADCDFSGGVLHDGTATNDSNYILVGQAAAVTPPPEVRISGSRFTGAAPTTDGRGAGGVRTVVADAAGDVKLDVQDCTFRRCGYDAGADVAAACDVHRYGDGSRVLDSRFFDNVTTAVRISKSSNIRISGLEISGQSGFIDNGASPVNAAAIELSGRATVQTDERMEVSKSRITASALAGPAVLVNFDATGEAASVAITGNLIDGTKEGIIVARVRRSIRIDDNDIWNLSDTESGRESIFVDELSNGSRFSICGNHLLNCAGRIRVNDSGALVTCRGTVRDNVSDDCASSSGGGCITIADVQSLEFAGNTAPNLPAGASPSAIEGIADRTKTIDGSGVILVDPWPGSRHLFVDTFAAATTDDLVTISGGTTGQILTLSTVSGSRDVVLVETGNISIDGATSFTLGSATTYITLIYQNPTWYEIGREVHT